MRNARTTTKRTIKRPLCVVFGFLVACGPAIEPGGSDGGAGFDGGSDAAVLSDAGSDAGQPDGSVSSDAGSDASESDGAIMPDAGSDAGQGGSDSGQSDASTPSDGGAPDSGYRCPPNAVIVQPDAGLAQLVKASAGGTTFCLQPGIHHDQVTLLAANSGDVFTSPSGTTADGVIENGAETLSSWTLVTLDAGSFWTTAAGAPIQDPGNDNTKCAPGYLACFYPQALFVDGGTYQEVGSLGEVVAGSWYYEMDGLQSVQIVAAGVGYASGDVLAIDVDGGVSGKLSVTAVSDAGGVTALTIIHPGYDYPPSAIATTTETTSWQVPPTGPGKGTGCTLQIKAGSGAVRNNVYLASSETPASATVELGVLPYFVQTNDANDITVQGLIVEKYAGYIDFAAVSMSWSGSNGTAVGWHILNNEVRLNQHVGIHVGFGVDGGQEVLVQNNWTHHNGQFGIGGGNNSVFIAIQGNTIDHNNTVHVNGGYGSGGYKTGAAHGGVLVSGNTVHDDDGVGLWSDVNSKNVTYDHNLVYNETSECIRSEISSFQTITNNTVYGCTGQAAGQIVSASSSQVDIEYNTVIGTTNAAGIIVNYDNARDSEHPGFTVPQGMKVEHNSVTVSGPKAGTELWDFSTPQDLSWETAGTYDFNTYCVPPSWDGGWPSWGIGPGYAWETFPKWQSGTSPQDTHGQLLVTGNCPAPSDAGP
jgi:hypothetical protein